MQEHDLSFPWRHRLAALLAGNLAVLLALAVVSGNPPSLESIALTGLLLLLISGAPGLLVLFITGDSLPPWWAAVGAGMLTGFLAPFLFLIVIDPRVLTLLFSPRQMVDGVWGWGTAFYWMTMPMGAVGGVGAWAYLAWFRRRQLQAVNHTS